MNSNENAWPPDASRSRISGECGGPAVRLDPVLEDRALAFRRVRGGLGRHAASLAVPAALATGDDPIPLAPPG